MNVIPVTLSQGSPPRPAQALLQVDLNGKDFQHIESCWQADRDRIAQELEAQQIPPWEYPETLGWRWGNLALNLRLLECEGYGIRAKDNWQGAMLLKTRSMHCKLVSQQGEELIYGAYLESAPWNWTVPQIGQIPEYKLIATQLIRAAITRSLGMGSKGRIGLHALPTAEGLYRRFGFSELGEDPDYDDLVYFESTPAQAQSFLMATGGQP